MSGEVLKGELVPTSAPPVKPMTSAEWAERDELETCIESAYRSQMDAGMALLRIRDAELYRSTHPTFAAYLEEQWQISTSYAYRQIDAAELRAEIAAAVDAADPDSPIGETPIPVNEAQTRELRTFKGNPELAAAVMRAASKDGPATAKKIKAVVRDIAPKAVPPAPPAQEDPADPDPGPPPPPVKTRTPAEQKVAERAYDAARSLTQYRPEQVDEKTVRLLEAWCLKWRNQ